MSVLRDYAASVSQPTLPFPASADVGEVVTGLRFDEVVDLDGGLRPAWKAMASVALALTPDELTRVEGEISRFLADDGVTYVRPDTGAQPWQLDPVPLIIDAPTWGPLDVGLAQRAELLNAILLDLYGPRTLLRAGTIPSAAIFSHSGFIRSVARGGADGPSHLLLSAAEICISVFPC